MREAVYETTTTVDARSGKVEGNGLKPSHKRKSGAAHALMAPIRWAAKSCAWLATPTRSGGAQYIAYALSFGCFGLSVENFYVAMHPKEKEEHRFIYKLGLVDDGANMGRLLPFPAALKVVHDIGVWSANLVGADIRSNYNPRIDLIVWADPKFYAAIVGAFILSALQAAALRQVSLQTRKAQLAKAQKLDAEVSAAVGSGFEARVKERTETVLRKQQVKHYGNGKVLGFGVLIALSFLFEFWLWAMSAKPGTPFFQSLILAMASTIGPEMSYGLAKDFEQREDGE